MGPPIKKLPPGYEVGMRIKTNARYAICHTETPGAKEGRYGTILGGSRGQDGPVLIKLDVQKHPKPMPLAWFDIVEGESRE